MAGVSGADGAGFGAVECARGRLYHAARLDWDGRIASYGVLTPTDWNFAPAGPLVAQLVGSRVGPPERARLAVSRLIALVDPCAAHELSVLS